MSHRTISPQELYARIAAGTRVELIDVRTPAEYRRVHAVGARHVPLVGLDPGTTMATRQVCEGEVFILCHSGARAREAADRFVAAGYTDVVVVEGGTKAWEDAGLPVLRGSAGSGGLSVERQTQLVIGIMTVIGAALAAFVHPWYAAIPGFIGLGLISAGLTGRCPLAMVIAAMPWNSGSCATCAAPQKAEG